MYPRNAASPERVAIGAVVQISDGAVQTSGVSVKVLPIGTTASAGGGTIAYEEGIVYYLPTQAETNYTSFILIAYKTGCIPASVTVVTTASATPGTVLLAPVTHTGAVVPTVTTLTGHTAQTGDAYARLGAPAGASVSADVAAVKAQTAAIETDTQDIQSRIPAALVSGRMDASVGAMASGVLTATAIGADAITAAKIADGAIDAATFAAGAINAAAIASDAITDAKVASDVTIASVTGAVGSVTAMVTANVIQISGDSTAADNAESFFDGTGYAGTNNVIPLVTTTTNLTNKGDGSGFTAIPWNASWDAEVQSEVQDAIEANHLDHLLAVTYDPASKPGAADALLNELVESDGGVARFTANALEQAPSGTGASAASIAAALFTVDTGETEATAVAGSVVYEIVQNAGGGTGLDAAGVRAALGMASADLDTQLDGIKADTAATLIDTAEIGAAGAGLTALASAANLATVDTVVDAIKAKTDNLPSDPADESVILAATNAILTAVGDVPTNAELATALGTADDAVLAQVALVKAKTDLIPAAPAAVGDIPSAATIADAVHDEVVEGTTTLRQSIRLANAALGGKASGLDTTNPKYRDLADTKDRLDAVVDADGNRTAVTRDLS